MIIGIPRETRVGETRVAATPETVKKLAASGKHEIVVEAGAGVASSISDADYQAAGARIADTAAALGADIVLKVRGPAADELPRLKRGALLIGLLDPFDTAAIASYAQTGVSGYALEWLPRISRAQSMDVLSSQANIAGYKAVLIAAEASPKFFPMLTTAAGTIRPSKVLIIGAGVAGLQAIATARRLGGQVAGFDVRPETKEQIQSLGAKYVELGVSAAGTGGYARELTPEERAQQQAALAEHIKGVDVIVTTAAVPGRKAPRIITKAMVEGMKPGSVIVDIAAETGGNCEATEPGKTVTTANGVTVIGPLNLAATTPIHASELYAKNLYNFLELSIKDGGLNLDWDDELIAKTCVTHAGQIKHEPTKQLVEGAQP